MEEREVKVVHILQYGRPQCMFTIAVPRDWPEGHFFLTWEQAIAHINEVTCEGCLVSFHGSSHD